MFSRRSILKLFGIGVATAVLPSIPVAKEVIVAVAEPAILPYKAATSFDAGAFYCPYIPLQIIRGQDPELPAFKFKSRYDAE